MNNPMMAEGLDLRVLSPFEEGFAVALRAPEDAVLLDLDGRLLDLHGAAFRWILPFRDGQAQCCRADGTLGHLDLQGVFHAEPESEEWRLRHELVRLAHLVYERHYNASIDGNLSTRLPDGNFLITPSGLHNGFIRADQLVVMAPDGSTARGPGRASSERILHLEVYRTRPDIGAVIHSHAPCAIAASLAGIDLMEMVISMAPVPTAEYAQPSSPESAERMRPFLQGYDWGILPRHGVVCLGHTPWDAFLRLEGLEHYAHIALMAHSTGRPITPLGEEQRRRLLDFWGLGERGEARQ